jgi:hypothetical protein
MQDAVDAAQKAGGGTVYLEAGTYEFDSTKPVVIKGTVPVTIAGAGRTTTTVMETAGPNANVILDKVPGVTVNGITFNGSAVHGGAGTVTVETTHSTIENCRIIGGPLTKWPLRFAGGEGKASPLHPSYMGNNTVDNLILSDDAPEPDDGLDFSFQENGTITDVQLSGSRLGLYVDNNVTVTDFTYTPNPADPFGDYGYFIGAPGNNITITDFTTSGNGGVVGSISKADRVAGDRTVSTNITIVGERMLSHSGTFYLGDVRGLTVRDSQLARVLLRPQVSLQGVFEGTTYASVVKKGFASAPVQVNGLSTS